MLNILFFKTWFCREKFILIFSLIVLTLGFCFPWYNFPPETVTTFHANLILPLLGRTLTFIFLILELIALFGFLKQNLRLLFWTGLFLTILFPYFVINFSPENEFIARSFTEQSLSVISHIERNFVEVQTQWKQNIKLVQVNPISSTLSFVAENSSDFNLSAFYYWLESGLGYNNRLFWCIDKGWGLTLIGLLSSLLGIYMSVEKANYPLKIFSKDLIKIIPILSLSLILILVSLFLPSLFNRELDSMYAKGQYSQVVSISQKLVRFYPPFSGDAAFLERWGKASIYSNKPDSALVDLSKAFAYSRANNFLQTQVYLEQTLKLQPRQFLARGYLASLFINQGVTAFNRYQPSIAINYFNAALNTFPNHINALYYLMLAHTKNGEFEQANLVGKKIRAMQKYMPNPSLALLGQTYVHSAWSNYGQNNLDRAWEEYRKSVDKNQWK